MDVGVQINQYTVVEHIGRGGMADVWSARDTRLNRTVAIKTIARDLAADVDPVALFEREAQTIAQLEHPHILPIYDFGEFDGQLYIVMRYVTGGSLEDLVTDGPMAVEDALRIGRAVGSALDYAHTRNVIHLDIKPSNILLDSHNSPYLADFGLATVTDREGRAENPGYGTLLYMAPEQLTSAELDARADIYSFTILMFHLLTGELPFDATTSLALKQLQSQEDLPPLESHPHLSDSITPVLRRGTALSPDMRPATVEELINELEAMLAPKPVVEAAAAAGDLILIDGQDEEETAEVGVNTVDLSEVVTLLTPDEMAKQEAVDLYERARRAWAHGQGRFLLGITHFMLMSDYYIKADEYGLEVNEAGLQMLLRGALEYDHQVDEWWAKLDDSNRRWVALHAVRSDNAPARARAIKRLESLPDSMPPKIAPIVAQQLQVEPDDTAKQAALNLLAVRAVADEWRERAYSDDIDELLAEIALDADQPPAIAEQAARTIGRIRSRKAVAYIAEQQRQGHERALRALAFIRDEAPSLPPEVSDQARLIAWLDNTWRRLSDKPMGIVWRFVFGFLGGTIAMSLYAWINLSGPGILVNEKLGRTLSTGITVGVFVGLVVVLAGEVPARLRGFWPTWMRLLAGSLLGMLSGALIWTVYAWLLLYLALPTLDLGALLLGGLGIALGFAIAGTFNLRGWLSVLLSAAIAYVFIWYSYTNLTTPFLYFRGPDHVLPEGLLIAVLIAIGGFAQALWTDIRKLLGPRL